MKILNLYAGIGGNRKLWDEHEITAVESDAAIAEFYASTFPRDRVVVGDAHEFLLRNFRDYDFIWSSPPCQSHGQYRFNVGVTAKGYTPLFPDMKLYEEIIFLKHHAKGWFVVENTKPYYEPLIQPTAILARHLFWSNFSITPLAVPTKHIRSKNSIADYADLGFDLSYSSITNKRQALRNCVDSTLGSHILNCAKENNHDTHPRADRGVPTEPGFFV